MFSLKEKITSNLILVVLFLAVMLFFGWLQFLTPTLYGFDAYYHVAVSRLIEDSGPLQNFRWAQFSTFKNFFSDKDFLLHVSTIPFLYFTDNIVTAGKYAVVFFNFLFLLSFAFILRKYIPGFLTGLFLLLPALSPTFSMFFLYLRPTILAIILTIFLIYFLINKKWLGVLIVSIIYPLTHISFLTVLVFAFFCEAIRYMHSKEIFERNIYVTIIGLGIGCIIHPNFPHNSISVYLNAILVPWHTFVGTDIDFGREFIAVPTKQALISNFMVFFSLGMIIWFSFWKKVKVSFSSLVWFVCFGCYFVLAMLSNRYWYVVNPLFFVFFASYINDVRGQVEWKEFTPKINRGVIVYFIAALFAMYPNCQMLKKDMSGYIEAGHHYENVALWMKNNIPSGETVYHALWSDSPFFICLNPKNNYVSVLDPIYTIYCCPGAYALYRGFKDGAVKDPHKVLKDVFGARFGYAAGSTWLYQEALRDNAHFKVMYQDRYGIVFKLIDEKA
ncbi:MAG: hypothetical protein GY858_00300 [Candidatus Omnitrophica bacterium]|nr:hypothetical protein [Candidatus Omnitrophota bacterium]